MTPRSFETATPLVCTNAPVADARRSRPLFGRPLFPADAVARIFRPCRSVMTSGRARTKGWRLVFERRTAPFIEPLMGWTGGDDTLTQVELSFPTLEAAVAYAEQQGLDYVVQAPADSDERTRTDPEPAERQAFLDMISARLALAWLQTRYGLSGPVPSVDREKVFRDPAAVFGTPADVVVDPEFSVQDKRTILRNWAWNEYLADLATAEGMPDSGRPSRLHEVGTALLELEKHASSGDVVVLWRKSSPTLRAS
jgi:hypothetical protein